MRRAVLMGVGLAMVAAACGRVGSQGSTAPVAPAPAPALAPGADAADTAAGLAGEEADFVGVWAERPDLCGGGQTWRFTHERLSAANGVSCAVEGAARSAEGWSVQALCTASGAPRPAAVTLSTAGPAPATGVTVSGGPFGTPVSLVRCTPPLSAAVGGSGT